MDKKTMKIFLHDKAQKMFFSLTLYRPHELMVGRCGKRCPLVYRSMLSTIDFYIILDSELPLSVEALLISCRHVFSWQNIIIMHIYSAVNGKRSIMLNV